MLDQSYIPGILKKALQRGGDFSELFYENSHHESLVFDQGQVESINFGHDQGVGLRLLSHHDSVYGFTNELSKKSLNHLATTTSLALSERNCDKKIDLKKQESISQTPLARAADTVPLKEKQELCSEVYELAKQVSDKIESVRVQFIYQKRLVQIANSTGRLAADTQELVVLLAHVTAQHQGKRYQVADAIGGQCGFEIFTKDSLKDLAHNTAKRALQNLGARSLKGGKMPVVISSHAGGTLIHEAVGHGLEADLVSEGLSVYSNKLGEMVASPLITVVDDSTLASKRGSFGCDDEGEPAAKTVLIQDGKLTSYLCDHLSAQKLGLNSTANGRRQSYEYRPIVRMTNTYIQAGDDNPQDIVSSLDSGIFIKKMGSGQVDTVTGDFVFEVSEAYLIENGVVSEPIKGITLIGNGPQVLKDIDRVGNDQGFSLGTCGKDAQSVPVSDALPTIRIPEMIIGGV